MPKVINSYIIKMTNGRITIPTEFRKKLGIYGKSVKTSGYLKDGKFIVDCGKSKLIFSI